MKEKILKLLKLILGWPIAIISLFFVFRIIGERSLAILPKITNLNYISLIYGVCFLSLFFFIRSIVWQKILKNQGVKLSLKETSYLWGVSELKRYTPGNIWSFIARTLSFSDKGIDKKIIGKSLLIEIELFIISSLIVSLLSARFIFNSFLSLNNDIYVYALYLTTTILSLLFITKQKFSYYKNALFLFLYVLSFFMFGLGTYFAANSVFSLDPRQIIILSSFFVFSWLIGYLSIITPMGLGVREGVITLGLSKILSLSASGTIAIFSRLILVISELLFVLAVVVWNKSNSMVIKKVEFFVKKYKYETLLLIFILFYIHYFTLASFLRFDNFYTGKFDLGNMAQTVWNTINGNFFLLTDPNSTNIVSRLSFHADFILILLAPFYWLWANPKMLLLIQTVVIAGGGIYVYLISNHVLKSKNISLVFAFAYLINPLVQHVNLYDFHAVALATTFLLAAFYYILQNRLWLFFVFAVLAGITKEQVWIITGLMGIYAFVKTFYRTVEVKKVKNTRMIAFVFSIISFFIFYYLIWHAIPNASGAKHFALSYYSELGESPGKIIINALTSPLKIVATVFQEKQLTYLYNLFLPLGFLSVFSPLLLIFAIPDLAINILSNNKQLSDIYYQYTATITPFLFISSIYGFKFLSKKISKNILVVYLLVFACSSAYLIGPLPFAKHPNTNMFIKQLGNRTEISKFLDTIPTSLSIAATNNLGAYLSNREKLYVIPIGTESADMVMFLLNDSFAQPSLNVQKEMAKKLELDLNYQLLKKTGDFVAFKRKSVD